MSLLIKKAEFKTSISTINGYIEVENTYTQAEICVVGRSNVGKSSFINMIAAQKKLAKTSSQPGRTRLINLFNFNDGAFMLVDLPGYGYAKASKTEKDKWGTLIEGYLTNSKKLAHVFCLVDLRHEPTVQDKQMISYLFHYGLPFSIVACKADKLSKAQIGKNIQSIATSLSVGRDNIIAVSAQTNFGKDLIIQKIDSIINS